MPKMMKRPYLWLRFAAILCAGVGALFFLWRAPMNAVGLRRMYPQAAGWFWPGLIFLWIVAAFCYLALWEFWKMAGRIGRDESFCRENAESLSRISLYLWIVTTLFGVGIAVVLIFRIGRPGLMVIALFFLCACAVVAILAAALSALVQKAVALKEQADLTI